MRLMQQHHDLAGIAATAVEKAGGAAKLARLLGKTKSTIHSWKSARIPVEWVSQVSEITGIAPSELRPDLGTVLRCNAAHDGASHVTVGNAP